MAEVKRECIPGMQMQSAEMIGTQRMGIYYYIHVKISSQYVSPLLNLPLRLYISQGCRIAAGWKGEKPAAATLTGETSTGPDLPLSDACIPPNALENPTHSSYFNVAK